MDKRMVLDMELQLDHQAAWQRQPNLPGRTLDAKPAAVGLKERDQHKKIQNQHELSRHERADSTVQSVQAPAMIPVIDQLRQCIGQDQYRRYFGRQAQVAVRKNSLEITTESAFLADLIDRRFGSQIKGVAGRDLRVVYRVKEPKQSVGKPNRVVHAFKKPELQRGQLAGSAQHRRKLADLEDFVVGGSNRIAYAAAVRLADPCDCSAGTALLIHGPSGMGKTHLLQGIAQRFKTLKPSATVRYVSAEAFMNDYVRAIRTNTMDAFRKRYRKIDLLCIDDVHFLANKVGTQSELLHTFDELDLSGARVALVCDEHPRDFKRFSKSLISRFLAGMVASVEPVDEPLCRQLIRNLAARRGLMLDGPAVEVVARVCQETAELSVRVIEGTLTRLQAAHRLLDRKVDGQCGTPAETHVGAVIDAVDTARAFGVGTARRVAHRPLRPVEVVECVCGELGVGRHDVLGRSRHARVVAARALSAMLLRELTTMSYPEIAGALGRSNHSTAVSASKRMCSLIEQGASLRAEPGQVPRGYRELADRVRSRLGRQAMQV